MKYVSTILALALLLPLARPSHADQAMILDQAYAEDASANLTFSQARNLTLTPFTGTLLKGYTAAAIWVRLRIAKTGGENKVYLTIEPQFLDEIALYGPRSPDARALLTGDRHPGATLNVNWHGNVFRLLQEAPQQEYWLRIRSTSAIIVNLKANLHDAMHVKANAADHLQDLYNGILLVFLLWSAGMMITRRGDRVVAAFFIQQLSSFLMSLSYFGYLRSWFSHWPGAGIFDFTTSFFIIATTATTARFHYVLLATSRPNPRLLKLLEMTRLPIAATFALLISGYAKSALELNMFIVTTSPFLMFAIALSIGSGPTLSDTPSLPRTIMILFYSMFLLLMAAIGLSVLGLLQIAVFLDYRAITLFSAVFISAFLYWRALRFDRMRVRMAHRSRQLRQKIHHKRRKLEEQDQFMSMLSHELKTPLSILRLATSMSLRSAPLQQHSERAILDITTIIDRCAHIFEMEQSATAPVSLPIDVEHELRDLCARKNAARIRISGHGTFPFATDRGLFRIIVGNLIDNALKYGDPAAPVNIRILPGQHRQRHGVLIDFSNTPGNAGFPDAAQLFEKFYRAPAARRESGAGLGLHIVRGVSKGLGGTIDYIPSDKLIRFRLWLPSLA